MNNGQRPVFFVKDLKLRSNLIPEVFVPETGCFIKAAEYFDGQDERHVDEVHAKRRELLRAKRKGEKLWVCAMCQEPIYIASGLGLTKRRAHFKHFVDTPRCPYQTHNKLPTETIRRIKYNGAKESPLHRDMKEGKMPQNLVTVKLLNQFKKKQGCRIIVKGVLK